MLTLVLFIIFIALVFDFLNGFHDAANSIATIVSTRVLTPVQAVAWAAFFNFIAAFVFGTEVAKTIANGMVDGKVIDIYVVLGGLVGAIIWNIITWLLALPTSSSHALVGGVAGAAIAKSGIHCLLWDGWSKVLIGIVLAPVLGLILGAAITAAMAWIFRRHAPWRIDTWFRRLQLVSSAFYSLGHGGNDAQKTMGIIVMVLTSAGMGEWTNWGHMELFSQKQAYGMPIILSCNLAIALGTMFGGWRIVKTMGSGITRLQPVGGFAAETAAALVIGGFTKVGGVPISTTHAITGAIIGVGSVRNVRSVRWIWGQRILMAWVLTLPCSAFMAGVTYLIVHHTIEPLMAK